METFLKIENIKLWARVGVLDEERELGQLFILDIFLWTDFEKCTAVSYTHLTLPTIDRV